MDYGIVAESFETSMPWDRVELLCDRVKNRVNDECDARGIKHRFVCVTHGHQAQVCVCVTDGASSTDTGVCDVQGIIHSVCVTSGASCTGVCAKHGASCIGV